MKIIISDFDKTFFTENYEKNIEAINKFVAEGNKFVIATGRPIYFLEPDIDNRNILYCDLICSDGTVIFNKEKEIIYREVIDPNTIKTLAKKIENNPYISDYFVNTPYENTKDLNAVANGFLGVPIDREKSQIFIDELGQIDKNIKGYLSHKWINIISNHASKSFAIKELMKQNNWNYEDIITVGDSYNDIEMNMDFNSYCMSYSPDELKQVSNYVVGSFEDVIKNLDIDFNNEQTKGHSR